MAERDGGMGQIMTLGLLGVGAYILYEYFYGSAGGTVVATTPTTPGTTPTQTQTQSTTSVSTTPTTTTPPPSGTMQVLAANMTTNAGATSATADQWNYVFNQIMGKPIDLYAGFSFDAVYGPLSGGVRNNGAQMNAMTFLQLAASAVSGGLPGLSGLGTILNFANRPAPPQTGNMIYMFQHPFPYSPNYSAFHGFRGLGFHSGLGAFTQASGFEKALFAGQTLHRYWA